MSVNRVLSKIYYTRSSPASFSGINKLYKEAKKRLPNLKLKEVSSWLSQQDVYTKYRPIRTKFEKTPIVGSNLIGYGVNYHMDLIDYSRIKHKNSGYAYILIVIEALSRKMYCEPMKKKDSKGSLEAFKKIYSRLDTIMWRCTTDAGAEFVNSDFRGFCEKMRITHIISQNLESHAFLAERAIRTLKNKISRSLAFQNSERWIDVYEDLVDSYNRTVHRSIGVRPIDVNIENENNFLKPLKSPKKPNYKFKVNDLVRVARFKGLMYKGYKQNFSDKIYKISKLMKHRVGPASYKLADLKTGISLDAVFYNEELSAAGGNAPRKSKYL